MAEDMLRQLILFESVWAEAANEDRVPEIHRCGQLQFHDPHELLLGHQGEMHPCGWICDGGPMTADEVEDYLRA